MSKKSIDFGEDVCFYEDVSNDFKLMYVKGCPSGKLCLKVESEISEYQIHTCQPSVSSFSKRQYNEACDPGLYECEENLLECKEGGNGKCSYITPPGTSTGSSCTLYQEVNGAPQVCVPIEDISSVGLLCYKKTTTDEIKYTHYSTENASKSCKKLNIEQTGTNTGVFQISSKELVAGLYSIPDGDYVDDISYNYGSESNEYCQSGFSLYFFGDNKQKSSTDTKMFKRCVTVLDLKPFTEPDDSTSYLIKYKINNGDEHIYDTSKLSNSISDIYKTKQNEQCEKYLVWPKLDLLKLMTEEYKAQNGTSNKYIKWKYLHENPKNYLLYKDQPEVLDYLIQKGGYSDYVPEGLNGQTSNEDITQPTTNVTTNTTNETEAEGTEEPNNQSSRFLNIKYLFILLLLYFF